jgi:hypothetical protein
MENFQLEGSGLWHSEHGGVLSGSGERWEDQQNSDRLEQEVKQNRCRALEIISSGSLHRGPALQRTELLASGSCFKVGSVGKGSSNKLAAFAPGHRTGFLLAHSITSRSDIHRSHCVLLPLSLFLVVTIYLRLLKRVSGYQHSTLARLSLAQPLEGASSAYARNAALDPLVLNRYGICRGCRRHCQRCSQGYGT